MTTKDFKQLVRERMAKTGESYSIARMHLLRSKGTATPPAPTPPAATPPHATPVVPTWTYEWMFEGQDIAWEILRSLYDDLVDVVHSGDYPVGYTEFEELVFKDIDQGTGTAEFHVQFTAEHPSEGFEFNGHVEGELAFDTEPEDKEEFLDSLRLTHAEAHFDMGEPD